MRWGPESQYQIDERQLLACDDTSDKSTLEQSTFTMRALLVSRWEVESDAAVALITGAVGELAKSPSIGRGEALRRAMLAMTADTSRPASWIPAAHPSVWAAFVVVGEGGVGR